MAESVAEQIAAALRTLLAGITSDAGATYWYTPTSVLRVAFFPPSWALTPTPGAVVYVLSPGSEDVSEETTSRGCASEHEFVLQVAKLLDAATENPYLETTPTRWTVVNRLVRDVLRCLFVDVTLSGLVRNISVSAVSVDREQYDPRWAMAQLRFTVSYSFPGETP
jgi:hypothetical protein